VLLCNILHNICEIIRTILTLIPTNNHANQFNVIYEHKLHYKVNNLSHISCLQNNKIDSLDGELTLYMYNVTTLTLGSWPRQRLAKVWGKSEAWESYFMLLGGWQYGRVWKLNLHTPKWTPTLGVGIPMDFWIFRKRLQGGQNPLDWRIPYTIGNILELRCLKWARMTHLDIWNTNYGQKKGRESNLAIWLPTNKMLESPQFPYVKVVCNIPLKSSWQGLQIFFTPHLHRRFSHKVMALQICGSPNFGNFETPTWESRNKLTFGC
jgi:hypothetical protein